MSGEHVSWERIQLLVREGLRDGWLSIHRGMPMNGGYHNGEIRVRKGRRAYGAFGRVTMIKEEDLWLDLDHEHAIGGLLMQAMSSWRGFTASFEIRDNGECTFAVEGSDGGLGPVRILSLHPAACAMYALRERHVRTLSSLADTQQPD